MCSKGKTEVAPAEHADRRVPSGPSSGTARMEAATGGMSRDFLADSTCH